MEFHNTKKIAVKGGYFQIATGDHEKYGKSIAISVLNRKQQDGKWLPDYDNRKTVLCSFNQASKVAAYLRVSGFIIFMNSDFGCDKNLKIGKTTVHIQNKDDIINFSINNGDSKNIELNFETANIVADLITNRLNDLEIQDEIHVDSISENNDPKIKEYEMITNKLKKTGFFTDDGLQEIIENARKEKNIDYLEIVRDLAKSMGVKLD